MSKKTSIRTLVFLGLLWLALAHDTAEQETVEATTIQPPSLQTGARLTIESHLLPPATENNSLSNWQNCFKDSINSTQEFAQNEMLKSIGSESIETANEIFENLHIQTPQGQEKRLHVRINDQSGKREALLFDLDSEGFPILSMFPDHLQNFSVEEKKEWFMRQGHLDFTEKTLSASMNGSLVRWQETNGRVKNLEASFLDRSLSCGETLESCICRL